jgi:hypothetical protein
MGACQEVMFYGGGTLPEDQGIAIGKSAVQYVIISRHYYNVAQLSGVKDTGRKYEIQYTAQLRKRSIQKLMLRINPGWLRVPPATMHHTVRSMCAPVCTRRIGTAEVLAVGFHMHGAGRSISFRVVRDGKEIAPIAEVKVWRPSAAFQKVQRRILLPGDRYLLDCIYDNAGAEPITGGPEASHEMCNAIVTIASQTADPVI